MSTDGTSSIGSIICPSSHPDSSFKVNKGPSDEIAITHKSTVSARFYIKPYQGCSIWRWWSGNPLDVECYTRKTVTYDLTEFIRRTVTVAAYRFSSRFAPLLIKAS